VAYNDLDTNLEVTKWEQEHWTEYVRESGFKPYMGSGVNSIIQTKRELIDGGKDLIIPLVGSLKGRGKGAGLLTGQEDKFDTFDFRTRPYWRRNATLVKKSQQQKSAIDLLKAQKDVLKLWSSDDMRERLVDALSSVDESDTHYDEDEGVGRQVPFAEATATQKNNWLTDNQRRALFGITEANLLGRQLRHRHRQRRHDGRHLVRGHHRRGQGHGPQARPRQRHPRHPSLPNGMDGKEYFVLFCGTRTLNKLRADADIKAFNKDARPRDVEENPVFQGGDLMWNGVIIHEIPELPTLTGVGASSCDVEAGLPLRRPSAGRRLGFQDPKSTQRTDDDYGFIKGVGTEELRSVDKTFFGLQRCRPRPAARRPVHLRRGLRRAKTMGNFCFPEPGHRQHHAAPGQNLHLRGAGLLRRRGDHRHCGSAHAQRAVRLHQGAEERGDPRRASDVDRRRHQRFAGRVPMASAIAARRPA
jgi:hypothetical protein